MKRFLLSCSSALLLTLSLTLPAAAADRTLGGPRVSVDVDSILPLDEPDIDTGIGAGLRLGNELDLVAVTLTPEIAGTAHSFANDWEPELYRGTAGLRLSVGKLVEPGVFAHVGVGDLRIEGERGAADRTAFTWDGGLTLDLTLIPVIQLGAHASYGYLAAGDADESLDWVLAGAHVTFSF
jgi:hypothetical protein